jgi:hypothetical protein
MQGMEQSADENCPFSFSFDPATFKPGDTVGYRVTGGLADFPFVGLLVAVHEDHVIIATEGDDPAGHVRGTRESRPVVDESEFR